MGRSRAVAHSADEEDHFSQSRSKRKRTAQNVETTDAAATAAAAGGGTTAQGKKALYHCNYCNKDISGKIRIKCVMCSDFDLCVECFSVGAKVSPHKCNHPYRVMDNLSFPLICPDWNADEEILLLEGIEMYGFGNWNEVAEHVGTKSKSQCIEHYNIIYMNSPCFPLPDMSHVMGKNREELLAMARERGESQKGFPTFGEAGLKEDSSFSRRIKTEDQKKEGPAEHPSSGLTSEIGSGAGSSGGAISMGSMKVSSIVQNTDGNDGNNEEESYADRSIGEKKPRASADEGATLTGLSNYNPKRQEFEIEYDNDAEQLLADMEFKESDTNAEHELKLRVLRIYSKRLDERKRRKDFILERNLLYPDPFEKGLSHEEKEICHSYKVFMRFHSREEHAELLRNLIEKHHILKRVQDLQDARAAGCRTAAEAERYIEQKRKNEAEEYSRKLNESTLAGSAGKGLQRANHLKGEFNNNPRGIIKGLTVLDFGGKDYRSTNTGFAVSNAIDDWDVTGLLGADLLSESEKQLCGDIKILPTHYLRMLQTLSMGILSGNITKKADAHSLFNVDPNKVDKVYDMLVKKGITQA